MRLLHAGLRLQHGRGVLPAGPRGRRPATSGHGRPSHEHGPNGFDLHALSGNLCRCTGYRPIRDAAYALGAPADDDALAAPLRGARAGGRATRVRPATASSSGPATSPRPWRCCAEQPDADRGRRLHRLGRRGQPPRRPRRRSWSPSTGCPSCATLAVGDDADRDRRRAHPHRDRAAASTGACRCWTQLFPQFASRLIRNGATLGGNLGTGSPIGDAPPALLALEASRGAGRRPTASARCRWPTTSPATARRVRAPGELIRAVRIPLPLAPLDRLPQDRQAPVRRHLQRGGRLRARRRRRRRRAGPDRARRRRRDADPRHRHRGRAGRQALDRGDRRGRPRAVLRGRGHADRRPPGQRRLPRGDARPERCSSCTPRPRPQEVPA